MEYIKIKSAEKAKSVVTNSMQVRPMIDSDCEYEPESDDDLIDEINW